MATLIRDDAGRVARVVLYNQVPGGKSALEAMKHLEAKFREGVRIAIAEPYYKVAADGSRAVRVDSPSEVKLLNNERCSPAQAQPIRSGHQALTKAAARVRKLLEGGEAHLAMHAVVDALHTGNEVVALACTLLNNRAQALLRAGRAAAALRDAAAVLMMHPQQAKAWMRYAAALRALGAAAVADRADVVAGEAATGAAAPAGAASGSATPSSWSKEVQLATVSSVVRRAVCVPSPTALPATPGMTAAQLKDRGNARYQAECFAEAEECYTQALDKIPGVGEVAALLALLAEACLRSGSRHSAAAAAGACIRVAHVDGDSRLKPPVAVVHLFKALLGLGEHRTCTELLAPSVGVAQFLKVSMRRELLLHAGMYAQLESGTPGMAFSKRIDCKNCVSVCHSIR